MPIPKDLTIPKDLENKILALEEIPMEKRIAKALSVPLGDFLKTYKTRKQTSDEIGFKISSSLRTRTKELLLGIPAGLLGLDGFGGTSVYYSPEEQEVVSEFLQYQKPAGRKPKVKEEDKE